MADDIAREWLAPALTLVARRVAVVDDARELMRQLWRQLPDIIIVAGSAHSADIPELCRRVREFLQTPILVVEEGASEGERISWLDCGADDVLALRRMAPAELGARCAALVRRVQRQQRRDPGALRLHAFGLQLDIGGRRLHAPDGQAVDLPEHQLWLLAMLFSREGGVITSGTLAEHLAVAGGEPQRRLDGLVSGLNRRFARLRPRPFVERVHGRGYRLSLREVPAPEGGALPGRASVR